MTGDHRGFVPDGFEVPSGLDDDHFVLEPLTTAHVVLDYEAVMAGREMLRVWSGTGWPADDFALEENRADLERHEREHRADEAYTYTVLTPDRRRCLGCVYLTPLERLVEVNPDTLGRAPAGAAVLGFWVVPAEVDLLASSLLERLVEWMRSDWPFSTVYFSTHRAFDAQRASFAAAGLVERFDVEVPGRGGRYILYEPS